MENIKSQICIIQEVPQCTDPCALIMESVAKYDIVIFAKSYCPHYRASRTKVQDMVKKRPWMKTAVFELYLMGEDGKSIQESLLETTGQRTSQTYVLLAGISEETTNSNSCLKVKLIKAWIQFIELRT